MTKREPFIKDVTKGEAIRLIKWWNRHNGEKFHYYKENDGMKTLRKTLWNVYRQTRA